MKREDNNFNMKGLTNGPIKICPVCGFSFRSLDPATGKIIKLCPMCGFKFIGPNVVPEKPNNSNKKILY